MQARSGVWLEGLSKSDAQVLMFVAPWALVVILLLGETCCSIVVAHFPSMVSSVQLLDRAVHFCVAVVCAGYLPVAAIWEVLTSFCCRRDGSRRSCEGWLALLLLAVCAAISFAFALGSHVAEHMGGHGAVGVSRPGTGEHLQEAQQERGLSFVHGSWIFRAAATGEFLVQLLLLWVSDRLRYPGRPTPYFKRCGYLVLILFWMLTLKGPKHGGKALWSDHVAVFVGYSARYAVFFFVALHSCHRWTGFLHRCCCNSQDWQSLSDSACKPGRGRLRYLLYHVITRPRFMLLIHMPFGYPLAFLSTTASAVRCCFALMLAVMLRPAPAEAMTEHSVEQETRHQFDARLALRLLDYASEAYTGPPTPPAVVVRGCSLEDLNGTYYVFDQRDTAGYPVYGRPLPDGLSVDGPALPGSGSDSGGDGEGADELEAGEGEGGVVATGALLRRNVLGEWEIAPNRQPVAEVAGNESPAVEGSPAPPMGSTSFARVPEESTGLMVRWAFAKDENAAHPVEVEGLWYEFDSALPQPLSNTDLRITADWQGLPTRRFERHGECREADARWVMVEEEGPLVEAAGEESDASGSCSSEVSLVLAFRGTETWSNVSTDMRFTLQPLKKAPAPAPGAEDEWSLCTQLIPAVQKCADWYGAGVHAETAADDWDGEPLHTIDRLRERSRTSEELVTPRRTSIGSHVNNLFSLCCRCWCGFLCRCCIFLCFPCQPGSDIEDDDKEVSLATLDEMSAHSGFVSLYAAIREEVMSLLTLRLALLQEEGRPVRVYITGHSMGGAIASLCALDFASLPAYLEARSGDAGEGGVRGAGGLGGHEGFDAGAAPGASFECDAAAASARTAAAAASEEVYAESCGDNGSDTAEVGAASSSLAPPWPWPPPAEAGAAADEAEAASAAAAPPAAATAVADAADARAAAMALAAALPPAVYTFGQPRLGNAAFRSIYNGLVPQTFRVVASRDPIPSVPPTIGYRQLGREVWLDDTGYPTFVMSLAMRNILPARDNILFHLTKWYYRLLARTCRHDGRPDFISTSLHDPYLRAFVAEPSATAELVGDNRV